MRGLGASDLLALWERGAARHALELVASKWTMLILPALAAGPKRLAQGGAGRNRAGILAGALWSAITRTAC